MNLNSLIKLAATRADDLAAGKLWSRAEWIEYANDAQDEACRRARLITDSTTAEVCSIALLSTEATYELHDSIIFVRRVRLLDSDGVALAVLRPAHSADLDMQAGPQWQEEVGQPRFHVPNMDTHLFRPYPSPDTDDWEAALTVVRTAIVPTDHEKFAMEEGEDTPEIRTRWHLGLVNWMLARAYRKHDSQTYNAKLADAFEADFEREFGKKSTAIEEAWQAQQAGYVDNEGQY